MQQYPPERMLGYPLITSLVIALLESLQPEVSSNRFFVSKLFALFIDFLSPDHVLERDSLTLRFVCQSRVHVSGSGSWSHPSLWCHFYSNEVTTDKRQLTNRDKIYLLSVFSLSCQVSHCPLCERVCISRICLASCFLVTCITLQTRS